MLIREESHPEETHTLRNSGSYGPAVLKVNSAELLSSISQLESTLGHNPWWAAREAMTLGNALPHKSTVPCRSCGWCSGMQEKPNDLEREVDRSLQEHPQVFL